jgi:hypothetical protein
LLAGISTRNLQPVYLGLLQGPLSRVREQLAAEMEPWTAQAAMPLTSPFTPQRKLLSLGDHSYLRSFALPLF